jgi:dihydropteroate synthase
MMDRTEEGMERTVIMGILNVTPDSFTDGGMFFDVGSAVARAKEMVQQGADIIDIGGESSRPGAKPVSAEEELRRILPVIKKILSESQIPISVDTYKPRVAEECLKAGALIINDITGLRNEEMINVCAKYKASVVIMHMKGNSETMQDAPKYEDIVAEIIAFFRDRIAAAEKAGITKIILDPGMGYGKTLEHNIEILRRLSEFRDLGYPLMIGTSRKSFIKKLTDAKTNQELLPGTLATVCVSVMGGVDVIRVHDVMECRKALDIVDAVIR